MATAILDQLKARIGEEIGVSDWIAIDQATIDAFADVTGDHQFIHVDPAKAAMTPLGGTVAHGFLTLSLLSQMAETVVGLPAETELVLNFGFEKVRFIQPVRAGKRVRGRFVLQSAEERAPGQIQTCHQVTVEIEGETKPALAAAWLGIIIV